MTTTSCDNCSAETSNGLQLCEICQRKAVTCLEFLPLYFRNLARWTPGRTGSRQVPGSRVLYSGETAPRSLDSTGDRISDRLNEALNALTAWVTTLGHENDPRPWTFAAAVLKQDLPDDLVDRPAETFTLLVAALERNLTRLAAREHAGQLVRDLNHHEKRLRALTENYVPGWYAGKCTRRISMQTACGAPTYVVPGLTWVTCRTCGSTTYARDHLDTILDEARGWTARPKALAEAVVALVDTELSVPRLYDRIRQWAHVGDIQPIHHTAREHVYDLSLQDFVLQTVNTGPARYRLGEVLDLVYAPRAVRTTKVR